MQRDLTQLAQSKLSQMGSGARPAHARKQDGAARGSRDAGSAKRTSQRQAPHASTLGGGECPVRAWRHRGAGWVLGSLSFAVALVALARARINDELARSVPPLSAEEGLLAWLRSRGAHVGPIILSQVPGMGRGVLATSDLSPNSTIFSLPSELVVGESRKSPPTIHPPNSPTPNSPHP